MKTLSLMFGTGLLCTGLALGCAESGTDPRNAANEPGGEARVAEPATPAWVSDTNITQAHLQVTGMD